MRLGRVEHGGRTRCARLDGDRAFALEGDLFGELRETGESVPLADCRLLAPVEPPQIVAIGLNYRGHAAETGRPVPEAPVIFIKTSNTVVGPGAPIVLPEMAPDEVDYEAELVIVIGRTAKHVAAPDVDEYVLGYTCGNDVSARDCQLRLDRQWARGKCFDTFAPIGPWIETDVGREELGIRFTLNDTRMQDSSTSDMVFDRRRLVSYVSDCMTLLPGSIIMSGTPAGVGHTRTPPVFLRQGDIAEVEIDRIGRLANPVVRERR